MKPATASRILIFIEVLTQIQRELITSICELAPVLGEEKWISPENVLKVMSEPN